MKQDKGSSDSAARHHAAAPWPTAGSPGSIEVTVMNYAGLTSAAVVTGFTFYHYFTGNLAGALINALIVALLITALIVGTIPRLTRIALLLFGAVVTVSCVLSAMFVSTNGLLWAMLVLWINFLILPRRLAIVFNLFIIVVLAVQAGLYESLLEQISWIVVATLISGFGLIFTNQMRAQREMLAQLATLDPLTAVGNRRLMQHDLERAIAEQRRHRRPSTLLILDLDYFKQINDRHGHEAGDDILKRFASMARGLLRTEDGLYRLGGEEFVILIRDMDEHAASANLDHLHRRLSGQFEGPEGPLRCSAGAAILKPGENWSRWLARADHALYQAKRAGRNRLVIA